MNYISLPLAFMHPSTIVMHPPKSMAFSGLSLYSDENMGTPAARWSDASLQRAESSATYVVTQASGRKSMLDKVALFSRRVETVLCMQAGFNTSGKIRFCLTDAVGSLVLEREAWLADGAGSQDIEMSRLRPGHYNLLVSWTDAEEESAVMYQIEKLL